MKVLARSQRARGTSKGWRKAYSRGSWPNSPQIIPTLREETRSFTSRAQQQSPLKSQDKAFPFPITKKHSFPVNYMQTLPLGRREVINSEGLSIYPKGSVLKKRDSYLEDNKIFLNTNIHLLFHHSLVYEFMKILRSLVENKETIVFKVYKTWSTVYKFQYHSTFFKFIEL